MKLYAIRDKETGKLIPADDGSDEVTAAFRNIFWAKTAIRLTAGMRGTLQSRYELVTLRIEPSEPCVSCDEFAMIVLNTRLPHERWNFCPMCGRSLT